MTFRFPGLAPALALPAFALLVASAANAQQYNNQGGQMAYPAPLPSGQVKIPDPTARDTGNMAYPASPGGLATAAPTGRDTGNMAYPGAAGQPPSGKGRKMMTTQVAAAGPAPAMRPDVAPTPAQTATARSLDVAPAAAPVPYTDFLPPARPTKGMPARRRMMHKAAAKMPAKAATPASAPAAAPVPAPSAGSTAAPGASQSK